jgi:transcription antitermination factor NusG
VENHQERWFIILTEPQQEILTVWRLHELGLELFAPVVRRRIKTGRIGKNRQPVTRVIAKPMFPGYGFIRESGVDIDALCESVRGIRGYVKLRQAGYAEPVAARLPNVAIQAVFKKQMQQQHEWMGTGSGKRQSVWKSGDMVRVDTDGGAYAGLVATVDKIDTKGRIELLFGMIRHTLPADMVVAA